MKNNEKKISLNKNKDLKKYFVKFPKHVAIIMDGNGRWAKNKGKIRTFGHQAGMESTIRAINFAINNNISVLTLYAFSKDNWNRPHQEVSYLMYLFTKVLNNEIKNLHKSNVRLKIIGDISCFEKKLKNIIYFSEKLTNKNRGMTLNVALNYSGRWDIVQGVKKIAIQVKKK